MKTTFNKFYKPDHARSILRIGWPLIVNNLAIMGMSLADTIMSGRLSTDTLAAVAAGGAIWSMIFMAGMGLIMALSPITAQYYGANKLEQVGYYLRQTIWVSILISIPLMFLGQHAEPVLHLFKLEPEVISLGSEYLSMVVLGLPLAFCYMSMRMTSEGITHTRPIMYISIVGMLLNIFFNWVLMYGKFGIEPMGAKGCGLATAFTLSMMFLMLLVYIKKHYRYEPLKIFSKFDWPNLSAIKEIFVLGIPISVSLLAEIGLFSCAALLMGGLGKYVIAAHQVAINYAAFMFMVPFAMSMANTSVVGNLLGQGNPVAAKEAGRTGMILCTGFMCVSALVMILFAEQIIGLYTKDIEVATVAVSLLGVAAAFQLVDGLQVAAGGALRGFKDTQLPMVINVFSYWAIGFVLAWGLGIHLNKGPVFVWIGLVAGLFVAAILLTWRFEKVSSASITNK